ncbi:MAG: hypothetical protein CO064_10530 [Anaerolineae bacterium CG_4_9_14_0_8_um_filter_58_9]|nr:MAG: hypothetical protein CO064_10530 [Anaerolineae bacterium CG_4_9_14_0_8_um_filter_58_9]
MTEPKVYRKEEGKRVSDLLQYAPHKSQELTQCLVWILAEMTLYDVIFTTIVKVMRESGNR